MTEHIKLNKDHGVLEISFARADKKNALSNAMYRTASDALNAAQTDSSVRVVLFSAEGDTFTAGNDLGDFANAENSPPQAGAFINAIIEAEKPIIAAVQGRAVGVGATMLLHCDLVYMAKTAKLTTPFVNLALVPEAGSSRLLPSRIGHARAFEMFALGEAVSGSEAVALGLANRVVADRDVLQVAREAAQLLATKPLGAVIATKRLMRDLDALTDHLMIEVRQFADRLRSDEAKEALQAFSERRPPDFIRFV